MSDANRMCLWKYSPPYSRVLPQGQLICIRSSSARSNKRISLGSRPSHSTILPPFPLCSNITPMTRTVKGGHKTMAFDGVAYSISVAEAHALPEQEFRDLFIDAINELVGNSGISALNISSSTKAGRLTISQQAKCGRLFLHIKTYSTRRHRRFRISQKFSRWHWRTSYSASTPNKVLKTCSVPPFTRSTIGAVSGRRCRWCRRDVRRKKSWTCWRNIRIGS